MGTVIFSRAKGQVARLRDSSAAPASIKFKEFSDNVAAIIQSVSVQPRPLYQVTDTLGALIFVLSFAETLTRIGLQGYCYQGLCNTPPAKSGIDGLLDFYEKNVVIYRNTPMTITLGTRAYSAYCFEFNAKIADPEAAVWQFELQLGAVNSSRLAGLNEISAAPANPGTATPTMGISRVVPATGTAATNGEPGVSSYPAIPLAALGSQTLTGFEF